MKKMKRFLSLLLCLLMVAGMLPVGASAANLKQVTLTVPPFAEGTSVNDGLSGITASNGVSVAVGPVNPNHATFAPGEYVVTLTLTTSGDDFNKGNFSIAVDGDGSAQVNSVDKTSAEVTLTFNVVHTHNAEYKHDDTTHWQECTAASCTDPDKNKTAPEGHVYVDDQDTKCDTCGYERTVTPAHQHTYGDDYSKDANGHWKQCVDTEDCDDPDGSKKDQGAHAYDNDQDASCNVCGYERTVTYTVTFHSNGGSAVEPQTVANKGKVTRPADPTKSGNVFSGWFADEALTQAYDFNSEVTTGFTLYAKWTTQSPVTYEIRFDPNGGTVSPAFDYTGTDGKLSSLPTPTREGFEFDGWFTAAEGGEQVTTETVFNVASTIYAHWTAEEAPPAAPTITGITIDPTSVEMEPGKTQQFTAAVTGTGEFDQTVTWSVAPGGDAMTLAAEDAASINGTGLLTLTDEASGTYIVTATASGDRTKTATATVTVKKPVVGFKITFDTNGGESVEPAFAYTDSTGKLTLEALPEGNHQNDIVFLGWFDAPEGGNKVTLNTVFEKDTTVYAHWKISGNEFIVTYVFHDGVTADRKVPSKKNQPVAPLNPAPTREGYTFQGWYTDVDYTEEYTFTEQLKSDITLHAKWEEKPEYTVSFDANGHGTAPASQTVAEGEKVTKPADLTAEGWEFKGWYTEAACTNAYDFDATVSRGFTLYAKWESVVEEKTEYTVSFNANGHGTAPASQTVVEGEKVTKPADPTAEGWEFKGWYTEANLSTAYNFDATVSRGFTLYAKWVEVVIPVTKYTVNYAAGDGTGTMTGDIVIAGNTYTVRGNEFTAPAGKTFKCWKIGDKEYIPGQRVAVAGDVTFTAVWQTKTDSGLDYVPKTGDTFGPMLWAFLLTFSAAALTGTVAIRRKRK